MTSRAMKQPIISKLALAYLFSITFPYAVRATSSDQCNGIANLFQCAGAPTGFCCPSGNKCMNVNTPGASTVLCCPEGSDCSSIQPITCDLAAQNATASPDNQLHSTNLTGSLDKCGSDCCPRGYGCQSGICVLKDLVSSPSSASSSIPTSTKPTLSSSAATATSKLNTASTSASSAQSTAAAASSQASSSPSAAPQASSSPSKGAIAGAVIGTLLAVGLLIAGLLFYLRRRRTKQSQSSPLSFGDKTPETPVGHRHKISEPIFHPELSSRSDFLGHKNVGVGHVRKVSSSTGGSNSMIHSAMWPGSGTTLISSPYEYFQPPKGPATPKDPLRSNMVTPRPRNHSNSKLPKLSIDTSSPLPRVRSLFRRSFTPSLSPLQWKKQSQPQQYSQQQNMATIRDSQETIDVVMPATSSLFPPPPPQPAFLSADAYAPQGSRNKRATQQTTFSGIMAKANGGYRFPPQWGDR